jgi:hypothetical protein
MKKKTNKIIKLTEEQIVTHLKRFIDECDGDELARITGDIFGGDCFYDTKEIYEFKPNEFYAGEFKKI